MLLRARVCYPPGASRHVILTLVAVSTDRSAGAPHQTKQQATGARAGMNCRQRRKHVRTTR
jgi:hypothetical protein